MLNKIRTKFDAREWLMKGIYKDYIFGGEGNITWKMDDRTRHFRITDNAFAYKDYGSNWEDKEWTKLPNVGKTVDFIYQNRKYINRKMEEGLK